MAPRFSGVSRETCDLCASDAFPVCDLCCLWLSSTLKSVATFYGMWGMATVTPQNADKARRQNAGEHVDTSPWFIIAIYLYQQRKMWLRIHPHVETPHILFYFILFYFILFYFIFLERGQGRQKEGEKHWCVREKSIGCLLHAPQPETWLATQACVLTSDLSVCRMTPNPLNHTSQGLPPLVTHIFKVVVIYCMWKMLGEIIKTKYFSRPRNLLPKCSRERKQFYCLIISMKPERDMHHRLSVKTDEHGRLAPPTQNRSNEAINFTKQKLINTVSWACM